MPVIPLLRRAARRHQLHVDVQHLHRPVASHVTRIGPQEVILSPGQSFMSSPESHRVDTR